MRSQDSGPLNLGTPAADPFLLATDVIELKDVYDRTSKVVAYLYSICADLHFIDCHSPGNAFTLSGSRRTTQDGNAGSG